MNTFPPLSLPRLAQLETLLKDGKEPPTMGSREFLELLAASAWALSHGYVGDYREQFRIANFQAALDGA
jgi:hypothetical protein